MNKKAISAFCLAFIFALLPVSGYGGYISMVIQTTITASPEKVKVALTVQNNGDEPAFTIYPELRLGSVEVELAPIKSMAMEDSHQWTHTFSSEEAGLILHGTYPLLIILNYHDSNMYPTSMPEVALFDLVKAGKELSFTGRIEATEVLDSGQVNLTLGNTMDETVAVLVRLLLPKELTTEEDPGIIKLQADQTRQIQFPITNKGALAGSNYKIFAVMEFDESGTHYSVLLSEMISVKEPEEKGPGRFLMIGGGGFIVLLFLLMVLLELRRREN